MVGKIIYDFFVYSLKPEVVSLNFWFVSVLTKNEKKIIPFF